MPKRDEVITPETLQRLVARAVELDEADADAVTPARAREIALELGISPAAWETALSEYRSAKRGVATQSRRGFAVRTGFMGALGLVAGVVASQLGESAGNVAAGAVLVAWSVAFAIRARNATRPSVQTQLAAWWAGIPIGMMLAHRQVLSDPIWFAALSWIGSAALARLMPFLLRDKSKNDPSGPPTTA